MAFAYGGRKRTEYRAYLYRMKPALSAVYSGLTRVPIYTDAVLARHVPQPRRTHTGAFQFAPDASDDDFDDIDAAPAEPAHASSSATSTSAAGQDVSTSTQPSATNAAELCDVPHRSTLGRCSDAVQPLGLMRQLC